MEQLHNVQTEFRPNRRYQFEEEEEVDDGDGDELMDEYLGAPRPPASKKTTLQKDWSEEALQQQEHLGSLLRFMSTGRR